MSYVILDGKAVNPDEVDPAKHRFLGMFRPAQSMEAECRKAGAFMQCSCGQTLMVHGAVDKHWRQGCFDVPQYVTIEKG